MKMRIALLSLLLAGGLILLTTKTNLLPRSLTSQLRSGALWSEPVVAKGAGLSADEQNNVDIYRMARMATVNISSIVYQQDFFFRLIPSKETGSGFFLDAEGRILTNAHVISGGEQLQVTLLDGSRYTAEPLARDVPNDLALIKIKPRKKVTFLRLGDSDPVLVGQKVLAIGNPFGLEGSLTTGIVSSLGRNIRDENNRELEGMIQTDAAINPGNSGGPLLDSSGNVIGINTAIYGPGGNIGIGFAMPINRAKAMITDLQSGRTQARPRVGVTVILVTGEFAEALNLPMQGGLLVQAVAPGSAAALAGIRGPRQVTVIGNTRLGLGGDLIMAIDGRAVDRQDAIARATSHKRPGDTVELTIFRDGRTLKVPVKLGEGASDQL